VEPIQQKNHNRLRAISVPGKALLFGEYGVMRGGDAVVVTLPEFRMALDFSFASGEEDASHQFASDFLSGSIHLKSNQIEEFLALETNDERRNFACYLSGFRAHLVGVSVAAEVVASFSPSLGFGSSSALLACFHIALAEQFFAQSGMAQVGIDKYWQRLFDSLLRLQGRGSGYDVAVQVWSALHFPTQSHARVLQFKNKGYSSALNLNSFEPEISSLSIGQTELRRLGCFVETGVRSDTRSVLKNTLRKELPERFFEAQTALARQFLQDPTSLRAAQLCREAAALALRADLLPQTSEIQNFVAACERAEIPWKTMGAGHGDCLWVMATRSEIDAIIAQISASRMKVSFAFEEEQ